MRARMALLALAATTLVLVAFLVPLALLVRSVAADRAVNAATLRAQSLVSVVATTSRGSLRQTLQQVNAGADDPVTVFLADGTRLGAPVRRTPAVELAMRGRSFTAQTSTGQQVLVAVQGMTSGPAVISTSVPAAEMQRGVSDAWLILTGLGVLLVGVGVLAADRFARGTVRPVAELAAVSLHLARGDLSVRARPGGPPEVRDVATALNHLAGRIGELLRQEREAAADLSHRLRTPLTRLRLDTESLSVPEEADRIECDVDDLERIVTHVIRQAREPARLARRPTSGGEEWTGPACDAHAVVAERVAFWSALAEDTDRHVDAQLGTAPTPVGVDAQDLADAVDALLGNVFAHTPDGTDFALTLTTHEAGGAELVVRDHGPGFPLQAGHNPRLRGVSGGGSTGLGLDIAARTADGNLRLANAVGGGAEVTLILPPVRQQPGDSRA